MLGRFDPSGLANDTYILRLTATDAGGNDVDVDTTVERRRRPEARQLHAVVHRPDRSPSPASRSPSPAPTTRSTPARADDFGFGWRLEFRDTDLRTSVPPTGRTRGVGIYNPFRDGTRVYVTLPGGRREGFTFQPDAGAGLRAAVLGFYDPSFVPDPGVTSRLSVPDVTT